MAACPLPRTVFTVSRAGKTANPQKPGALKPWIDSHAFKRDYTHRPSAVPKRSQACTWVRTMPRASIRTGSTTSTVYKVCVMRITKHLNKSMHRTYTLTDGGSNVHRSVIKERFKRPKVAGRQYEPCWLDATAGSRKRLQWSFQASLGDIRTIRSRFRPHGHSRKWRPTSQRSSLTRFVSFHGALLLLFCPGINSL